MPTPIVREPLVMPELEGRPREVSETTPPLVDPAADLLVYGDMLGDRIVVEPNHRRRADAIYATLTAEPLPERLVVAVFGPSGSGKSEIASLVGSQFVRDGHPAYILSADNYPHRPPRDNERYREELFAARGDQGLQEYLGSTDEIDFDRLAAIVDAFKRGAPTLSLRIMNNPENRVEDNDLRLDAEGLEVLVLEGTWSARVAGVDKRVFLDTNFEQTLDHRRRRARDPLSEFGERVLRIEQRGLTKLRNDAELVVALDGSIEKA